MFCLGPVVKSLDFELTVKPFHVVIWPLALEPQEIPGGQQVTSFLSPQMTELRLMAETFLENYHDPWHCSV